jgi:quercetin dioxygenase-like cupin family protein
MSTQDDPATPDGSPDDEVRVQPVDLRDHVAFSPDAAVRVRVFATTHLALDVWCLEPRQSTPVLHEEDRDLVYTVIGGRSWFVTDEGEIGLDPMGSMLVPAGTVHGIDNRAPDPLIIVVSSSPPSGAEVDPPVTQLREAIRIRSGEPGPLRRAVEAVLGTGRRREG